MKSPFRTKLRSWFVVGSDSETRAEPSANDRLGRASEARASEIERDAADRHVASPEEWSAGTQIRGGPTISKLTEPTDPDFVIGRPNNRELLEDLRPGVEADRRLRILLAEDNPFSRRVAQLFLEQAGHQVTTVENGREALEALARGSFDLVLMDLRMPEMDGFQASMAIRSREAGTSRHVPIVALTADAIADDMDLCLGAGMDDCLSKPLRRESFREAIEGCLPRGVEDSSADPSEGDVEAPLDVVAALRRVGGDRSFFGELAAMFLRESPGLITQIRDALSGGDVRSLITPAHSLKNWASNFGAGATYDALARIEASGRAGRLGSASADFPELERAIDSLTRALIRFDPETPEGDVAFPPDGTGHRSPPCTL